MFSKIEPPLPDEHNKPPKEVKEPVDVVYDQRKKQITRLSLKIESTKMAWLRQWCEENNQTPTSMFTRYIKLCQEGKISPFITIDE